MLNSFRLLLRDDYPETYRVVVEVLRRLDREVNALEVSDAVGDLNPAQVCGHMSVAGTIAADLQRLPHKSDTFPWHVPQNGVWIVPERIAAALLPRTLAT